jgi:hypothetical protein
MPQVTDHPHQGALQGRKSLTIPDDFPTEGQTISRAQAGMTPGRWPSGTTNAQTSPDTRHGLESPRSVLLIH